MIRQTKVVVGSIREWLDTSNEAREKPDPVIVARSGQAARAMIDRIRLVKSGHLRVADALLPVIVLIDNQIALASHVGVLYAAHRESAHKLVRFLRELEDTVRVELASATGEPVPPRSAAHDEAEDQALAGTAPPKIVLS